MMPDWTIAFLINLPGIVLLILYSREAMQDLWNWIRRRG